MLCIILVQRRRIKTLFFNRYVSRIPILNNFKIRKSNHCSSIVERSVTFSFGVSLMKFPLVNRK